MSRWLDGKHKVVVTEEKLLVLAQRVVAVVMEKNADYGDAWQQQGLGGALLRLCDKMYRIEILVDGREALVPGEGLVDAIRDTIGYALLGMLYVEELGQDDGQ